jgi:hypothetical protein
MVDREASRFSVQLLFGSGKTVIASDDKTRTDGYFNAPEGDESGVIAIATGQPRSKWLHTLSHEYAHMWQWFRDDPVYTNWIKKSNDVNYLALEEYTECQACDIIDKYKLPCGDHRKRMAKYLSSLRKDLSLD